MSGRSWWGASLLSSPAVRGRIQVANQIDTALRVLSQILAATKNPKMPAQHVMLLLHALSTKDARPMADFQALTGVEQSSVSRGIALLGTGLSPLEPGYGLLDAFEDPYYRRRKLVKLTPRGEALKASLLGH